MVDVLSVILTAALVVGVWGLMIWLYARTRGGTGAKRLPRRRRK